MLKGTMKIELTDVNTGQTETVLEHNMVTNALANIFKPLGLTKDPARMYESFAPYYQKLLGGLLPLTVILRRMPTICTHPPVQNWWAAQSTVSRTIPQAKNGAVSTRRKVS